MLLQFTLQQHFFAVKKETGKFFYQSQFCSTWNFITNSVFRKQNNFQHSLENC